jgi:hypothetical protein
MLGDAGRCGNLMHLLHVTQWFNVLLPLALAKLYDCPCRSGTSTVQPEQEEDERPPLEVAAALDWLRPRAASAVFNPLPTSHRRLENFMAAGVMSLLNVAHALDLVKPSAPRPVPFQKQLARPDPALSQDASTATAHQQELTINWSAVEPVVRVRHFSKYLGHDIFTEEEEEAGSRHGSPEKPGGEGSKVAWLPPSSCY